MRKAPAVCLLVALGCGDNLTPGAALPSSDASLADADPTRLHLVSTTPAAGALRAGREETIRLRFDRALDPASVSPNNLWAFGDGGGVVAGRIELAADDTEALLIPSRPLLAGDRVTVFAATGLRGADGAPMRSGGHWFRFRVTAAAASMSFREYARLSTRRSPGEPAQAYGGVVADLDHDGWPDVSVVNEMGDEVVSFRNRGDGTGMLDRLPERARVGTRPSPSQTADFDRDGNTDLAVANIASRNVTVLFGDGAGGFRPGVDLPVGTTPRGLAVLDADGDGTQDIAVANYRGDDVALLRNDGAGGFAAPVSIDGRVAGEWAIASADMNGDGHADLVVGGNADGRVSVLLGRGDGTFLHRSTTMAAQDLWQLDVGDLDGDGDVDVAVAGGTAANLGAEGAGVVLRNDGSGALGEPSYHETDPRTLATDLGDLDGDGDLDWVLSSVGGSNSDWTFLTNDGDGTFSVLREWDSPEDASCALIVDLDGDGDLDLALVDESEDLLILLENE